MEDENNICEEDKRSKERFEKLATGASLLIALLVVLGLYEYNNFRRKQVAKNSGLEAELANANSKIELLEASERYELNDVLVVTTSGMIFEKPVVNNLVTCKKYEMPFFLVSKIGKTIFEKDVNNEYHNLISDFDYWGEETFFISVKSGEVCGSMVEIYTNNLNENPNVDVVAKYTQINFNGESQIIKTFVKAGALTNYDLYNRGTSDFYITSLKDRLEYINKKEELKESQNRIYKNYIKEDLTEKYDSSNLFFTNLKDKLEYKNSLDNKICTSYTKEELIEIEDMLNEKSKKRILG